MNAANENFADILNYVPEGYTSPVRGHFRHVSYQDEPSESSFNGILVVKSEEAALWTMFLIFAEGKTGVELDQIDDPYTTEEEAVRALIQTDKHSYIRDVNNVPETREIEMDSWMNDGRDDVVVVEEPVDVRVIPYEEIPNHYIGLGYDR